MRPTSLDEAIDLVLQDARALLLERQQKYGPENIRAGGLPGLYLRLNDKLRRLWHLVGLDVLVKHGTLWVAAERSTAPPAAALDESMEDSHLDGVNYFVIAELVRRGYWGLPMASDESR